MPHLSLEHSADLAKSHDLSALADALFAGASAHPAFSANPAPIKIRMIPCTHVRMGTQPETFAHLSVLMLPGRDAATKQALAGALLAVLDEHLGDIGCLSVEPRDLAALLQ